MYRVKDMIRAYRVPAIMAAAFAIVFILLNTVIPTVVSIKNGTSPIVSIEVSNDREYKQGSTISEKDFTVTGIRENGSRTRIPSGDISLSVKTPRMTGKKTPVTVSYKTEEGKELTADINLKNNREAVISFKCGSPVLSECKAVLYSNGELCFEGKGEVRDFNEFPWSDYDADTEVVSVTFGKGVMPSSMDGWFDGNESLKQVGRIPASVKSMRGTFKGCSSLKKGPDWIECLNLTNITECFSGCSSLEKCYPVPASVTVASRAFSGCRELKNTTDLNTASSLIAADSMFEGCEALSIIESMPPHLQDASNMFMECINIKSMPAMPEGVITMEGTFEDCSSLRKLTYIPRSAADISACFKGCDKIEGGLIIKGDPSEYSGCFDGAAESSLVDLTGECTIKEQIVRDSGNRNITVDGERVYLEDDPLRQDMKDDEA